MSDSRLTGVARENWILAGTILTSGGLIASGTAVNVALPAIQAYFNTSLASLQWLVNANILTSASLLLFAGSLGDRFGRKRLFVIGIVLFESGAILAGLAGTVNILIALQGIAGIGAALTIPQILAIINVSFAESRRGKAIGLWAGLSGGISAVGPWLGGWLVQTISWRAVFFMMLPLFTSALIIASIFFPETENRQTRKLDWTGTLTITAGLLGIAYGLTLSPTTGWQNSFVLISVFGGLLCISLFIFVELNQGEPLLPFEIFKNPLVTGANLATLFLYFSLNGLSFFVILNLEQVQGYSPSVTGLALLPTIILITLVTGPAGIMADRIGPRLQMMLGPVFTSAGIALLIIGGAMTSYFLHFLPGLALFGIGMALAIPPLTKSALLVKPQFAGAASAVNNTVSRIAGLLAVAILGAVILTTFTTRLNDAVKSSVLNPVQQEQILSQTSKLGGIVIPDSFDETTRQIATLAIKDSFIYAFRWTMGINALVSLTAAVVSFIIIRPKSS